MSPDTLFTYGLIFRAFTALIGLILVALGVWLFKTLVLPTGGAGHAGDIEAAYGHSKLVVKRAAPGTVLVLAGLAVVAVSVLRTTTVSAKQTTSTTRLSQPADVPVATTPSSVEQPDSPRDTVTPGPKTALASSEPRSDSNTVADTITHDPPGTRRHKLAHTSGSADKGTVVYQVTTNEIRGAGMVPPRSRPKESPDYEGGRAGARGGSTVIDLSPATTMRPRP